MALRCAECGKDNPLGTFYCGRCASPLLPEAMIPPVARHLPRAEGENVAVSTAAPPEPLPQHRNDQAFRAAPEAVASPPESAAESSYISEEGERRYRIILGDTCPVCRMVSRISFTSERAPEIPIAGCREQGGCRCSLPIFAEDLKAALAAPRPSLEALAPERDGSIPAEPATAAGAPPVADLPLPADAPPGSDDPGVLEPERGAYRREVAVDAAPPTGWTLPSPIMQQRRHTLQELTDLYYQRRIQGIKLIMAPDCCRVCAEVGASIYEPSVAPTLPVVGCWDGWQCRCLYAEEPLPLDERSRGAMDRLQQLERERDLRRRKVARGGPRRLHQIVLGLGVAALAGILLLLTGAPAAQESAAVSDSILSALLVLVCCGVAIAAMRRVRQLPAPAPIYLLAGAVLAFAALNPLLGFHTPPSSWFTNPSGLSQSGFSPNLTLEMLKGLGLGRQILALDGAVLLCLAIAMLTQRPRKSRRPAPR